MAFAAGPEGTIRIPVEATGEEKISDDIFNAFIKGLKGLNKALAGFDAAIKKMTTSMEKQFEASNKRIERQLNNMFKNIPKAAASASSAASGSLSHMVPSGVEGAINRLIKQFDRLNAVVSKPPDLGLERVLERINRRLSQSTDEQARQRTASENTQLQAQAAATNAAAKQRVEAWRIMSRQLVLIERGIGKVISATFATAEKVVSAFARGATATIRGFARGAEAAFRGLGRAVSTAFSGMTRAIAAFARGAGRGFSGIFNGFRAALRRQEHDLSSSLAHQQRQIQNFQQQSSRGLTGLLTRGGALAGGFGIGALLTSGFERAGSEERLQLTFTTLLGDAAKAEAVLGELSDFARTTAFDFVEVAGSVAQLTAALGDVDEATALTKFLADVTALTGGTTESLGRVRLAISQIASAGKLDASNLRQLTESLPGIPFAQILADKFFKGDLAAFAKARDLGELGGTISADGFFDAFEEGVAQRFPDVEGFAVRAAGTLTGLAANMKENFSIFGAQIIRLFEGPIKASIDGINRGLGFLGDFLSGDMFDPEFFQLGGGFMQIGQDEANIERLKRLRENIFNVAKAIGGLLAIKGVTELFKLFGIALRRVLTPLGLLSLAVLGFAAIFNKLLEVTPFLRENFKVLGDQIKPTLKELGRLGKALFDLFSGDGGAEGGDSIFLKIGRAVQKFVQFVARGLVTIRTFAKLMADLLNAGRGDIAFEVIRIRLQELTGTIADFLGGSDIETAAAQARGGNDFLNILETTFLGPVVRFFRGPMSDALEGFGGFMGDIFNAIFGGGGHIGQPGPGGGVGGEGIGTRILNVLEDTFIGPVVRFFRGFVADVVERIGGGAADFGGFLGDIFNAIFGGDTAGDQFGGGGNFGGGDASIGARILTILNDTFLGPVVRFFEGPFTTGVLAAAGFATSAFSAVVDVIGGFLTLIEPLTDAIGGAVQGIFGDQKVNPGENVGLSGIWDGLRESLGNITERVAELLDPVFTAVGNWFETNFSTEKLKGYAINFFEFVREAGRIIGSLVTSKEVFVAVLAIGALGATMVGAFVLGFTESAIENAKEIGGAILNLIEDALGGIDFGSLPGIGLFADGIISAIIGALAIGLVVSTVGPTLVAGVSAVMARKPGSTGFLSGAAAFAGGVLGSIGGALRTAFSTQGRGLFGIMARGLTPPPGDASMTAAGKTVSGRFIGAVRSAITTAGSRLAAIGRNAAAAIAGGAVGFATGFATAQSGASLFEQILGVGGVALGIGLLNVPAGIAAGALGILGVVMGNTARQAEEMRDHIADLTGSLQGLASADIPGALTELIRGDLLGIGTTELDAWGQALINAGFDFRGFSESIIAGQADAGGQFRAFLGDLEPQLEDLGVNIERFRELRGQLQEFTAAGGTTEVFLRNTEAGREMADMLGQVGISADDATSIIGFFNEEIEASAGALSGLDATEAVNVMDTLAEGIVAVNDALVRNDSGQRIANILSQSDLTSEEALGALEDAADDVRQRLDDAYDAMRKLLDQTLTPVSAGNLLSDVVAQIPNIADDFRTIFEDTEISPTVRLARLDVAGRDFADELSGILSEGFESGALDTVPEIDAWLAGIREAIIAEDLPADVEQMMLGVVDRISNIDFSEITAQVADALRDQQAIQEAGEIMANNLILATTSVVTSAGGAGTLVRVGARINEKMAEGFTKSGALTNALNNALAGAGQKGNQTRSAGVTVDDKGVADARKVVSDIRAVLLAGTALILRAGVALGAALEAGIKSGTSHVTSTVSALANGAALAPFKAAPLMFEAGKNLSNSLAAGIRASASAAVFAATLVALQVAQAARRALKISSPSVVFKDIGRDIGRGFIQGIKDSEGDMTAAIGTALEKAITAGAERAGNAVRRAQVGQAIFDTLADSALPGGTTNTNLTQSRASLSQSIGGVLAELRSGASSRLGDNPLTQLQDARAELNGMVLDLKIGFESTRKDVTDALAAQKELAKFDTQKAFLAKTRASGALGQAEFTAQLNELKGELASGALSQDSYNKKLAVLNKELASGKLNLDKFNEEMKKLGSRPTALTISQLNLIGSGAKTLNTGTLAGQANAQTIGAALGTIREFGAAALEAGSPLGNVINEMKRYRNELVRQATAQGFTSAGIAALVNAYGLSDTALAAFTANLTSLNVNTVAGAENVAKITDQLQSIRDFGSELIGAGASTDYVTSQLKMYRDQLIKQATTFGFNTDQIKKLVEQAGLSDTALANFIKQLKDFDQEARNAAAVAKEAARIAAEKAAAEAAAAAAAGQSPGVAGGALDRPVIENMNLFLPTGDPESIALAVANRLSYGLLVGG